MKTLTCQLCGKEFETKANHAKFCPDCRTKAQINRNKKHLEKSAKGETLSLNTEQVCPECGNVFILKSASQKVCADCHKKKMIQSRIPMASKRKKENYDQVLFYIPKGTKGKLKEYAEAHNMSVSALVCTALEYFAEQEKKWNEENK